MRLERGLDRCRNLIKESDEGIAFRHAFIAADRPSMAGGGEQRASRRRGDMKPQGRVKARVNSQSFRGLWPHLSSEETRKEKGAPAAATCYCARNVDSAAESSL